MASVDTTIALVSLADTKEYLKIGDTSLDSILGFLINEASTKINAYVGHKLLSATYTEYYDGNGKNKLILKNFPISSVTSIHDDTDRDFTSTTLIASTDYYVNTTEGIVELLSGDVFTIGQKNIKVVYVAGYLLADVPDDLQDGVKRWIADAYAKYKGNRHGIQSESIGDRTTTFSVGDLPADVKAIINRHRDNSLMIL